MTLNRFLISQRPHINLCKFQIDEKAAEAVTTATAASRDPTLNTENWKTTDVESWLQTNHLEHLQTWYDATYVVNSAKFQVDLLRTRALTNKFLHYMLKELWHSLIPHQIWI